MITFRRLLTVMLAVLLLLSFAGCFDDDYPTDNGDLLTGLPPSDEFDPTPTPTATPEPTDNPVQVQLAEIQDQPGNAALILTAEKAVIDPLSNMILEPDDAPFNIGGWVGGGYLLWNADFPASGMYEIGLYYSRAYTEVPLGGTLVINGDEVGGISFTLPGPTSAEVGDWSVYTYAKILTLQLPAGEHTIEIYSGSEELSLPEDEHFINLRRLVFTTEAEYFDGDASDYADFTEEQRLEIMRYDSIDMGNPWGTYSSADVYGYIAWYTNDQYGLDLTAEDVEAAVEAIENAARENDDDEGFGFASRFYHVCAYYQLYPAQEIREAGIHCDSGTPLEFGEDPQRAKDDTDEIPDTYFG